MVSLGCLPFYILFILSITQLSYASDEDRQVYIVYMGALPQGDYSPTDHHVSLLQQTIDSSSIENPLVRIYRRSFNGFSAKLTSKEAEKLARNKDVVSVFPSRNYELQTTRSWDFIGLDETVSKGSGAHSDVIIGVIDTGIWPESESFNDEGFSPPPKHWKGKCAGGQNFTCNNKIIGAHTYDLTARDYDGHGSHTASIAAGNIVKDVSFYGLANGTARGGAPSARIAAYAVCGWDGCSSEKILSAFDDAIADGVDIITISVGGSPYDFAGDTVAIGAFHAAVKGILTFQSAGNKGPAGGTVASVAPWMVSVAASSIDRRFVDKLVLGNGTEILGTSVNSFTLNGTKYPLVYGKNASISSCDKHSSQLCMQACLNSTLVTGKIVLCDDPYGFSEALRAGAVGAISKTDIPDYDSYVVPLSALILTSDKYDALKSYIASTGNPEAKILRSETPKDSDAPVVPYFSSRGPNTVSHDILKPDVSAPGLEIIAAFTAAMPPSYAMYDKRRVKYTVMSGTSMACPHAAGLAALVKGSHQNWSSSAIQSAIMTTAFPMNDTKNPEAEFAYGAGQINPMKALDPGLVYEALKDDYINFLCGFGYDTKKVRSMSGDNSSCPTGAAGKFPSRDLNYPTMTASVSSYEFINITFHRTVTNVGDATSTYNATVQPNPNLKIQVVPEVLSFKNLNEKKSFTVTASGTIPATKSLVSTSLVWSDGKHNVRSPVVVYIRKY